MSDIIKLLTILTFIVLLLRRKYRIGIVLLSASALLALLYLMSPKGIILNISAAVTNPITIKLGLSLIMIRVLEMIMRENNLLAEMMEASKSLFRNRKLVIISMPMLIGMLPSLGGAYFSAPMVNESTKGLKMSQEEKGFINFWFRHPWEYILPLYPGILLASAVSGVELRTLIIVNLPFAVVMLLSGFFLSMREVKGNVEYSSVSRQGLSSFIPIILIVLLVMVFKVELHLSLIILVIGLLIFYRYGVGKILKALKYGFALDVILLVLGVMLFKELMEGTGAVSFAFASAILGVLLSPVHICLILTKEYFNADIWVIYKKMLPASAAIFLLAVIEYLILS
ncbi:MAG TPA: hypothetical protein DCY98_01310 [Nitrospinae bacterium]|nr:hypothetical protein [Nitrospinota bacterium]